MKIYTDGAIDNTDSARGGWAYVIVNMQDWIERSGSEPVRNANRMKMTAMLQALEGVIGMSSRPDEVIVYSDSEYCIECFSGRREVKQHHRNADLVRRCLDNVSALQRAGTTVRFEWIEKRIRHEFMGRALDIANAELRDDEGANNILETFLS